MNYIVFFSSGQGTTTILPGDWVLSTDYASLKLAVATGKHVLIPHNTTHTITPTSTGAPTSFGTGNFAEILLAPNQMLVGADKYTSKIVSTNGGGVLELDNYSQVHNITFEGPGKTSGLIFSRAITTWSIGWEISNCIFKGFAGDTGGGAYGGGALMCVGNSAGIIDYKDGASINNCWFENNHVAFNIVQRAEFLNVTNSVFMNNGTAISNQAGNNKFSNLNIIKNTLAYRQYAGSNDGHGTMVNCTVNHNTKNLWIADQSLGIKIIGSMFYDGDIEITNSDRVSFSGCDIDSGTTMTLTGNAANGVKIGAECWYNPAGFNRIVTGNDLVVV